MRRAHYIVLQQQPDLIIIRDVGPWDRYLSVTNAAESVIAELEPAEGQRVLYYDSMGQLDELLVKSDRPDAWVPRFAGFAPGPRP